VRAGFPLARVHSVIVTHSHPDHFGGAARLREETGAEIVTHESFHIAWATPAPDGPEPEQLADLTAAVDDPDGDHHAHPKWGERTRWGGEWSPMRGAEQDEMRDRMTDRLAFPTPTQRLEDAQRVRFARREWVAVHTPGHTPDHLCLFDPEHGVMLAGDHVLPTITPHIGGLGDLADPLDAYLSSLRKVAALDGVSVVLPAHGDPFTDLPGRVTEIGEHHEGRLQKLVDAAHALGREATVAELMRSLFSERAWGSMAESETFAHLEHLRRQGRAESSWHDDLLWFSVHPDADVTA
jgi:glyoxylase-like metal-dependent hydrolase (beta-lactamase superfamily II)